MDVNLGGLQCAMEKLNDTASIASQSLNEMSAAIEVATTPTCKLCGAPMDARKDYALGTNRKYCGPSSGRRCRQLSESLSRFSGELFRREHSPVVINTIINRLVTASQTQF